MQNPGSYRPMEYNEDENFASIIESDYLLSYLNDQDPNQRRTIQAPNLFSQFISEPQMAFPSFQEPPKSQETLQGLYGKINMQEPWLMANVAEGNKIAYPTQNIANYKVENAEDFDGHIKVKKIKVNKDVEIQKVADNSSKLKSNIKNTYINKINSLVSDQKLIGKTGSKAKQAELKNEAKRNSSIKNETDSQNSSQKNGMKKVRSCDVLKSDELEKLNQKLAKNRESARNSRIRKKVYIELLEKTVNQLQQELATTRKQLEVNTANLGKIDFQSKPMNNLYTAKQQLFERLEKMVNTKSDDSEISFLLDSLRLRFGATGKDRVEVVNSMFRQILDFLVPVHMKYLLFVASHGKDVFNTGDKPPTNTVNGGTNLTQSENTEYWNELVAKVNPSETQKKHMLKYRKKLLVEKQKFEDIVKSMNQVRKNVLKQATSLQTVVDEFRNYLSPTQTARLLLVLEKEKNRREFSAEKLWSAAPTKKENQDDMSDTSDNLYGDADGGENSQKLIEMIPSMDYLEHGR